MNDGNEVRALIPSFAEKMKFYPSIVSQLKPGVKWDHGPRSWFFFQTYQDEYNENDQWKRRLKRLKKRLLKVPSKGMNTYFHRKFSFRIYTCLFL